MEVWHTIQVLKRQGLKKLVIARQLGISRNTVKRYWHSQAPPIYQRRALAKGLDLFAPQIQEMLQKHFIGTRIFAELGKLGYEGSLTSLYLRWNRFSWTRDWEINQWTRRTGRWEKSRMVTR